MPHAQHSLNRPLIAILGSGQLAKMNAQAAAQLGCRVKVLENKPTPSPLFDWPVEVGDWNDPATLIAFAESADVVTLENEFIDADALAQLEAAGHRIYPTAASMALIQDKLLQKQTLSAAGLPVTPFCAVDSPEELVTSATTLGWPLVLKRRKLGYDGKGNATLHSPADIPVAWEQLGGDSASLYAEQFCRFSSELAIMIVRGAPPASAPKSQTVCYPVVQTTQRDHICHTVVAPAPLAPDITTRAQHLAQQAVECIDGIGAMGVELFLMADGQIVINEMAPRVHNSGHYTIEACHCSQFENHIRAILGWPLGSPALRAPAAAMVNLLGVGDGPAMPTGLDEALGIPGAHIHIYGKDRSVKGRKMGHVTALGATPKDALAIAQRAAAALRFG